MATEQENSSSCATGPEEKQKEEKGQKEKEEGLEEKGEKKEEDQTERSLQDVFQLLLSLKDGRAQEEQTRRKKDLTGTCER